MGDYIDTDDIDNWPAGMTDAEKEAIITKVEDIIDKACHTHFGPETLDIYLNGNKKNRLFIPIRQDIISIDSIEVSCVELPDSWYTYDKHSVYLDPCADVSSTWGSDALADGEFFNWLDINTLKFWLCTIAGTSTINRDSDEYYLSPYSCRLDIDALNSTARIEQHVSLQRNKNSRIIFYYKNSVVGKTAKWMLYNADKDEHLQADGTWAAGAGYNSLANALVWTEYSLEFTSHIDFATYTFYLENDAAASSSIYFDDASILGSWAGALLSTMADKGIFPFGYNNIQVIGTKGEPTVPQAIKQAAQILAEYENDPTSHKFIGFYASEHIGKYSYSIGVTGAHFEIITGVMDADRLLQYYIKRKPVLIAP